MRVSGGSERVLRRRPERAGGREAWGASGPPPMSSQHLPGRGVPGRVLARGGTAGTGEAQTESRRLQKSGIRRWVERAPQGRDQHEPSPRGLRKRSENWQLRAPGVGLALARARGGDQLAGAV